VASLGVLLGVWVLGLVGLTVLAYPILVTLERPVRVTPEQALKDYFGSLEHFRPQTRRMWLLLSQLGREEGGFRGPEDVDRYWREQLSLLRSRAGLGPRSVLEFRIEGFKADKSAGQVVIDAKYAVEVWEQGVSGGEPILREEVRASLSRGPDRMWYLDRGRLSLGELDAGGNAIASTGKPSGSD
jgi:hypothetical protein